MYGLPSVVVENFISAGRTPLSMSIPLTSNRPMSVPFCQLKFTFWLSQTGVHTTCVCTVIEPLYLCLAFRVQDSKCVEIQLNNASIYKHGRNLQGMYFFRKCCGVINYCPCLHYWKGKESRFTSVFREDFQMVQHIRWIETYVGDRWNEMKVGSGVPRWR